MKAVENMKHVLVLSIIIFQAQYSLQILAEKHHHKFMNDSHGTGIMLNFYLKYFNNTFKVTPIDVHVRKWTVIIIYRHLHGRIRACAPSSWVHALLGPTVLQSLVVKLFMPYCTEICAVLIFVQL